MISEVAKEKLAADWPDVGGWKCNEKEVRIPLSSVGKFVLTVLSQQSIATDRDVTFAEFVDSLDEDLIEETSECVDIRRGLESLQTTLNGVAIKIDQVIKGVDTCRDKLPELEEAVESNFTLVTEGLDVIKGSSTTVDESLKSLVLDFDEACTRFGAIETTLAQGFSGVENIVKGVSAQGMECTTEVKTSLIKYLMDLSERLGLIATDISSRTIISDLTLDDATRVFTAVRNNLETLKKAEPSMQKMIALCSRIEEPSGDYDEGLLNRMSNFLEKAQGARIFDPFVITQLKEKFESLETCMERSEEDLSTRLTTLTDNWHAIFVSKVHQIIQAVISAASESLIRQAMTDGIQNHFDKLAAEKKATDQAQTSLKLYSQNIVDVLERALDITNVYSELRNIMSQYYEHVGRMDNNVLLILQKMRDFQKTSDEFKERVEAAADEIAGSKLLSNLALTTVVADHTLGLVRNVLGNKEEVTL